MLHRKLLLRRLACVPWLLAVGLVLGWSGEAAADGPDTDGSEANHSEVTGHSHATDPYLRVSVNEAADSVFVYWSNVLWQEFPHGREKWASSHKLHGDFVRGGGSC